MGSATTGTSAPGPTPPDDGIGRGATKVGGPRARSERFRAAVVAALPESLLGRVLLAVLAVPYVVVAVRGLRTDWTPIGDNALELLRMHDVGGPHTPLTGVYSRFGWYHPGPLFLWLDAPSLRLFGTSGVLAMTALTNLAWTVLTVNGAKRLGGEPLAVAATVVLAIVTAAGGPVVLADPWNPWIAFPALLCFLFQAAAFAETGSLGSGLFAVLAGSFAVQSHAVTAPVAVGAALAAAVWFWRERPAVRRPMRAVAVLTAATVAVWIGPIVQQVRGPDGNLWQLTSYILHGGDIARPKLLDSLGVAATELGPRPAWAGFGETSGPFLAVAPTWMLAVVPLLLVALGWWGRRDALVRRACAMALWLHLVAVFAVTRTTGGFVTYVLRWSWAVGAFSATVLAWGAWRCIVTRSGERDVPPPTAPRRVPTAVAAGVAAVAVVTTVVPTTLVAVREPVVAHVALSDAAAHVIAVLEPRLPEDRAFNARWNLAEGFSAVASGVFADLARSGREIRVTEPFGPATGAQREGLDPQLPTLWVIGSTSPWDPPEGALLLARWSPFTAAERAERARLEGQLRERLAIGADQPVDPFALLGDRDPQVAGMAASLAALRERGEDYSVYLVPPEVAAP